MIPFRRPPWILFVIPAFGLYLSALLAGLILPLRLLSLPWWPQGSLSLHIDAFSWPYALSLSALALAVLLTAPARNVRRPLAWGGTLLVLLAGLMAVLADNLLTLALAWALLDVFELIVLLLQVEASAARERIVGVFSARLGGALLLVWASVQGGQVAARSRLELNLVLLLAVTMRLGVYPLHLPFLRASQPLRRGLGTTLRLVSPAASLWLLADIARSGFPAPWLPWLQGGALAAGLLGALGWLSASDALNGRPFWVLGLASLSVAAALEGYPAGSLGWGVTMVLCGAALFLASLRGRQARWVFLPALLLLAGVPYTPAGAATGSALLPLRGNALAWLGVHFLMLAGYVRFAWQEHPSTSLTSGERAAYFLGMGLLLGTAFFLGVHPVFRGVPPGWEHLAGLTGGAVLFGVARRFWGRLPRPEGSPLPRLLDLLSLDWLYRSLWRVYRFLSFVSRRLTSVLEGESGLLWMLVLLLVLLAALFSGGGQR